MTETDKSGQIVRHEEKRRTLASQLLKMQPEIEKAVPKHLDAERMARVALTALRLTPKLQECTLPSFLGSVLTLAQLGLEPNTPLGHAHLIPRKRGNVMECSIIIGYEGMLDLIYRGSKVLLVYAHVVRKGDVFDYDYGLNRKLVHKPTAPDDAPLTHCYAVAELANGHKAFSVLTRAQVDRRKKYAQGTDRKDSPWVAHEETMWKKTAVRELFKMLPRSIEYAEVAALDEAPEYGKSQTELYNADVRASLESHGIDPSGEETPEASNVGN